MAEHTTGILSIEAMPSRLCRDVCRYRKALGATPASIVGMIMQESLIITALAGYSGFVVGALLIEAIAQMLDAAGGKAGFFGTPEVDFQTAILALAVLMVAGVLASALPAAKAAAVSPIVALQDE